jgi:predicted amidohydrolase
MYDGEEVKIAMVQMASAEDKLENLKKILRFIHMLPEEVDIAIFPEYTMSYPEKGLTREHVKAISEHVDGSFVKEVSRAAAAKKIWLIINLYEREAGNVYNTNLVLNQEGKVVAKYRKIHLFDILGYKESEIFNSGNSITTFNCKGLKFGLAICHDIRFPELFRSMAMKGVETFLVSSAWFAGPLKEYQWHILGQARALENVAFLVNVNNAARPFVGMSYVADPYGVVRLNLGIGEKMGFFAINPSEIKQARKLLPLIQAAAKASDDLIGV